MKFKSILKFMAIGSIIICLYISFILNIEHFTISYNNKKQEHKNTYYKSENSSNILSKIGYAIDDYFSEPTQSNIDIIINSKIIRNIIKKYSYIEENEIDKYISKMQKNGKIKLLYDRMLYIVEDEYQLIFTLDVNNIEYRALDIGYDANINIAGDASKSTNANKTIDENKSKIYEKVRIKLQELGIIERFSFEPETLYVQYFYSKEELQNQSLNEGVYVIEDSKNHIKVEIEVPSYKIKNLQVGFEDYLATD